MRGEPDLELPLLRVRRRRNRHGALHVPGVVAADQRDPLLFPHERRRNQGRIASSRRSALAGALLERELFLRGLGVVINGSGVTGQLIGRPIVRRGIILTHGGDIAGAPGILDGFEVAHRLEGRLQNGPGIRLLSQARSPERQECRCNKEHPQSACHTRLLIIGSTVDSAGPALYAGQRTVAESTMALADSGSGQRDVIGFGRVYIRAIAVDGSRKIASSGRESRHQCSGAGVVSRMLSWGIHAGSCGLVSDRYYSSDPRSRTAADHRSALVSSGAATDRSPGRAADPAWQRFDVG